ncbi:Flp pilus assembly protein CpaB [Magnetospira sp. QH-2]|uniref:Flp pilus assembly protein CpaB n=1 Tax=Magnetospira sp. (strain QH-2) TaxID=1288970 RepID=UPI0003E81520
MTLRTVILLVVAIGIAAFTALFARGWANSQKMAPGGEPIVEKQMTEAVRVLVAKNAIPAGTFVKPEHMSWQTWPEEGLSEAYTVEGRSDMTRFEGAVARTAVSQGQPIMDAQVVHPGERGFLAAVLTPGQRAISVPVNATSGISGFVFPGDRVDLVLTVKFQSKNKDGEMQRRHATRTLMDNVRVLAIDQKVEQADGTVSVAKTATVEVTAEQAERIALALEMGQISLSLRSLAHQNADGTDFVDASRSESKRYTLDAQLFGVMGGGGGGREVHVLRGTKAETASF